jgi:LacI family transcriptional regulator
VKNCRITLRQVASAARLSVSAVSQALRNQPAIPQKTRVRVKAIADKLGYHPDPALSALIHYRHAKRMTERGVVLAYVTAFPAREGWRENPFLLRTFLGAQQRAERLGYRLECFWRNEPGVNATRFSTILESRGIRGLLVAPLATPGGRLELAWNKFSSVAIGPSLAWPVLHSTCNNHYQSMLLALTELQARGYRRIGLLLDPVVDERHQQKYQAAFWTYSRINANAITVEPLITASLTNRLLQQWLDRVSPDVVLAHDETVLESIERLRYQVPRDIAFANLILGTRKDVAGIDTAPEQIAALAVDRVASLLHEAETGLPETSTCTMLQGTWLDGATVRTASRNGKRHPVLSSPVIRSGS